MYRITVVTDSREKQELPFPDFIKVHLRRSKTPTMIRIDKEVDKLPTGDYTIKGFEHIVLVETKRSALEVFDNLLTKDYRRASRALERLSSEAKHKFLVCEFGMADLWALEQHPRAVDALGHEVARLGLSVWFAGPRCGADARRRTAELVLRLMLACVELESPNFLHGVKE